MLFPPYDSDDDLIAQAEHQRCAALRVGCPPAPLVVLGRGSQAAREVDLAACQADHIPVLRRRGGGCAVVLDPGNVIVSLALPVQGIGDNRRHIQSLTAWVIDGLAAIGVTGVGLRGVADLAQDLRKVGGTCIYRNRVLLYYSATLLVAPDVSLIMRYLRHPPREPDYRAHRDHAAFVGSIGTGGWGTVQSFARALDGALGRELQGAQTRIAGESISG